MTERLLAQSTWGTWFSWEYDIEDHAGAKGTLVWLANQPEAKGRLEDVIENRSIKFDSVLLTVSQKEYAELKGLQEYLRSEQ